ncbi:NAD+ synthase [Desulfothermobacter acidiphilus]|uniref:NAD+ synthase n=1 Tax=Desulfothermobacter acidiphilus TaxID=1938353 RepID=UPI003F8CF016
MKLALVQLNPTVGDVKGNTRKILKGVARAKASQAEFVIFPELVLVGYPPRDLLYREEMLVAVERALAEEIALASQGIGILVGAPIREGDKLFNAALLFAEGKLVGRQDKTLLPSYDVFDETRYFKPAARRQSLVFRGEVLGLTVCEDIWNDKDYWQRPIYEVDPVAELNAQGATLLINISASPYHYGKRRLRADMLAYIARKYRRPLVYVNQAGGNDELIFDGSSICLNATGKIIWEGKPFEEDFTVVDITAPAVGKDPSEVAEDISDVYSALILGIRDYFRKTGFQKAVVGLSGGIDSSVVAALAAAALGPENVLGVGMPSRYSSPESLRDAEELAHNLGIGWRVIPIEEIFTAYLKTLNPDGLPLIDVAEENIQARIRGNILMFISNREGHLVLSTGNKSELAVGYCTLYGDMSGGLAVLADVPKTMVYELARYINRERELIPQSVLLKPPSAELRPNQRDEDSLPPYRVLDPILKAYLEENLPVREIAARGFEQALVEEVIRRVDRAEYKRRQAAPGLRVTSKAFGMGRRMPIAWRQSW